MISVLVSLQESRDVKTVLMMGHNIRYKGVHVLWKIILKLSPLPLPGALIKVNNEEPPACCQCFSAGSLYREH